MLTSKRANNTERSTVGGRVASSATPGGVTGGLQDTSPVSSDIADCPDPLNCTPPAAPLDDDLLDRAA